MKQKMKQWLGALLSIALILGLMPGMSLTAYAAGAYNDYLVTTDANKNKSGDDLTALQVKFNEKPWYIIADNSTAVNAGTVTLLAADTSFGTSAFDPTDPYSKAYSESTVKSKLDALTAEGDSFAGVKDAIVEPDLRDVNVTGAKLYLLSTDEAENVPVNVRKFRNNWWLRSPGRDDANAAFVGCGAGDVYAIGHYVVDEFGVRPALKLNLASVIFSSESKEFSLKPAGYSVIFFDGANATTSGGATSQTGLIGAMTTVTYTANTGYYFAEFTDITDNGITATRTSSKVVTVSGTPTSDATITVPDAVEKTAATVTKAPTAKSLTYTGQAQGLVNAGEAENGTMQYALGTATEATQPYTTSIPTATDAGTYYVWYKAVGDSMHSDSAVAFVKVTIRRPEPARITHTVTFKVANGAWNDGTTTDKTVILNGYAGGTLKLNADQIPAVGDKPGDNYKEGSWDQTPDTSKAIATDVIFTYTYAVKETNNENPEDPANNNENPEDTANNNENPEDTANNNENSEEPADNNENPDESANNKENPKESGNNTGATEVTSEVVQEVDTTKTIEKRMSDRSDLFSTYAYGYIDEPIKTADFNSGLKISQKKGKIKVSWDKTEGVDKYEVYVAYCGKQFSKKPIKTTKSTSVTIKKIKSKKIDFTKNFKLYVKAYDSNGNLVGSSIHAHFVGKDNDKYKNPKEIKLFTKTLNLNKGQIAQVKASVKMESGKKKALPDDHVAEFRYRSNNENVAKVDKKGNVTAVGSGTCTVYVYARNGLAKKVSVTVN
ncbi:Ig-like domain-containing protein [Butyrivibrio sp. LC3010]|uniref:Ig-like domain-containing protein n=1 Tax=Butyrivibrio sp. LC3010 TaxID=1280680 RepID=UPI00047BB2D7|nr:Ig-like domain-containing protein [Butyrivibrio sp. LC3010]